MLRTGLQRCSRATLRGTRSFRFPTTPFATVSALRCPSRPAVASSSGGAIGSAASCANEGADGRAAVAALASLAFAAVSQAEFRRHASCEQTQRVELGKEADFEDGTMREILIGPEGSKSAVLVHRHGGVLYVTSPACSHYGAPLKKGVSTGGGKGGPPTVSCPLHDATFDLKTGRVVRGPSIDGIAVYEVSVTDGVVYAKVPTALVTGNRKHEKIMQQAGRRDPKDKRVFVLIGAGPASLACAETLRQEGFGGRIMMLTKEPHLPYDRVQLSKKLDKTADDLQLRPAEFFEQRDIEVLRETAVTKLDSKGKKVHYKSGTSAEEVIEYDRVLVASGGTPRKLFCPGSSMKGIHTLRTAEDAAQIAKYAKKGQKMIVVGGSFIGMEVASTLKQKGCEVSVIAMESVPFERVLGKKIGASFARLLQKEGIEWFGTSQVRLFRGNEKVNGVELEDGEVLPADAVVVGAGVLPNTRFVEGITLDKNGAIVVTPLLSSDTEPTLFAAGDVCSYPAVRTGSQVRIEHWDVATQQGRTAAKNMLGQYQPFTTTPFFWSQIMGKNLRFVGHAPEVLDRVIVEGDVSGFEFISYYTENDEIMAVATVNKDPLAVACAELMRRGQMPKVSELVLGTVNAEVILDRLRALSCVPAK